MAKIQVAHLRRIGDRYGALEADTGVPTINLKEGVSLLHETGRDLTASEGHYITYTISQGHVAAGTLESTVDPGAALNELGQTNLRPGRARWTRSVQDLWLLGTYAQIASFGGLTFSRARVLWDPGLDGAGLSPATQAPRNIGIGVWSTTPGGVLTGGTPVRVGPTEHDQVIFPIFADQATSSLLRFSSTTAGAGTMTLALFVRAWIGPRDTVPPFA